MNLGFAILLIMIVLALIATTLGALRVQNRATDKLSVTRVWLLAMLVSALVGPAVGGVWWLGIVSLSSDFVTWEERRQFLRDPNTTTNWSS